jgi:hypothetical protein
MWDQIIKADKEMGLPEIPYPTVSPAEISTRAGSDSPINIDLEAGQRILIAEWLQWGKLNEDIVPAGQGTDSDFNPVPGVYWLFDEDNKTWGCMWYWFGGDWAIEVYGDGDDFNFEVISMNEEDSHGNSIFTRHDQKGNWIKVFDFHPLRHMPLSHLLNWIMTKDFDKLLL